MSARSYVEYFRSMAIIMLILSVITVGLGFLDPFGTNQPAIVGFWLTAAAVGAVIFGSALAVASSTSTTMMTSLAARMGGALAIGFFSSGIVASIVSAGISPSSLHASTAWMALAVWMVSMSLGIVAGGVRIAILVESQDQSREATVTRMMRRAG